MERHDYDTLMALAPNTGTRLTYFNDRFALELLDNFIGEEGRRLCDIRASRFGRLLHRPAVKDVIRYCGDGWLTRERLRWHWSDNATQMPITLGRWASDPYDPLDVDWHQTSRHGTNLVLQVNFPGQHDQDFVDVMRRRTRQFFNYHSHPVSTDPVNTLGWARLDIEPASHDVLVEEIQSDWIRDVREAYNWARDRVRRGYNVSNKFAFDWCGEELHAEDVIWYFEQVLAPYRKVWGEMILLAVIRFARVRLGARRLYYHSWQGGLRLKGLVEDYTHPPRSIYTDLPRRFCFERTTDWPSFIGPGRGTRIHRMTRADPVEFWRLELNP